MLKHRQQMNVLRKTGRRADRSMAGQSEEGWQMVKIEK